MFVGQINSLPNIKILALTKLKANADDRFDVARIDDFCL